MDNNLINNITLEYLLNKEQYAKHLNKTSIKNGNKRDKKFYRKRIYSLTKELLLSQDISQMDEKISHEIKYAFNNYINTCIHYFKNLDNNDLIQQDLDMNELNTINELSDTIDNLDEVNETFIKTLTVNKNPLDNFVIKQKITRESIIIPKEKNIDLRDPVLRTKGVKNNKKKKNIPINYEETYNPGENVPNPKNENSENNKNN